MRTHHAQASIEYLSTYAWGFISLLITIGVLSYFGILNPSNYTPERCESGSQITCVDAYLGVENSANDAWLYIQLKNNYPKEIIIEHLNVSGVGTGNHLSDQIDIRVPPGRAYTARIPLPGNELLVGRKATLQFTVTYRRYSASGPTTSHTILGNVYLKAQEDESASPELYCGDGTATSALGEECDPPSAVSSGCGGFRCLSDCTCE